MYSETECCVCFESTTNKTICNHNICMPCKKQIKNVKCPICRGHMDDLNYVYDDEEDDEEDEVDLNNTCDCCLGGWDRENEYGWCECICDECDRRLGDCKYTCQDIEEEVAVETNLDRRIRMRDANLCYDCGLSWDTDSVKGECKCPCYVCCPGDNRPRLAWCKLECCTW